MTDIQIIELDGRPVAAVIGTNQAVISDNLSEGLRGLAERMCLYALEIAAGNRPGPYGNEEALRHATDGNR